MSPTNPSGQNPARQTATLSLSPFRPHATTDDVAPTFARPTTHIPIPSPLRPRAADHAPPPAPAHPVMTSAGGPGAGSPLIAGALTSSGEFHDFSDDDLGGSNLFDFSNSPDTLQSLDAISSAKDQNTFLNPQQLAVGPFPDSPNGSSQDSSSESAETSKRAASDTPAKTPATSAGDASMDEDATHMKMDWGNTNFTGFEDEDGTFNFGATTGQPGMNGFYGFTEQDDSFMDQSFDFESASSSPDALSTGPVSMASPGMPTIKSASPNKNNNVASKPKTQVHKKKHSVR